MSDELLQELLPTKGFRTIYQDCQLNPLLRHCSSLAIYYIQFPTYFFLFEVQQFLDHYYKSHHIHWL